MSLKNIAEDRHWQQVSVAMKRDLQEFTHKKGSSEDECVLDLLQALYTEGITDATKVMMLGVLQEMSESLFMDETSIEQAIGTLIGFYQEVTMNKGSTFLKSQILVCLTTLALTGNQLREQPGLFIDVTNLLFDVLSKVNQGADRIVREAACECLEEVENIYPGVLMYKLDHFYAMSQLENTHVRQSYVSLFTTVLKNAVRLKCKQSSLEEDEVSDLITTRKEPLKPLILPDMIPEDAFDIRASKSWENLVLPSSVSKTELRTAIVKCMDNLSLMSVPDTVRAIQDLCCICSSSDLPMEIFHDIPRNLTRSISLPCFHIQMYILNYYKIEPDASFFQDVIRNICHPALSLGHRLFCMQFCIDNSLKFSIEDEDLAVCKPVIFDSLDETLTKLLFVINLCQEGMPMKSFIPYLEPLMTSVRHGAQGKWAVACFRGLFTLYMKEPSDELAKTISDFIVEEAVSQHPHFAEHALNFIASVKRELPESQFPSSLLQTMTNFISTVSPEKCMENLEHFLKIFNAAAMEKSLQLKPVTNYIQVLFNTTSVLGNQIWLLGNQMIQICHNLMVHPSLPSLFTSVGEILFSLMTHHSDTNIRDVARFYYSMLIYLSEEKIKAILTSGGASSNSQNLTNLVTGTNQFPLAPAVIHLEEPVLQLKRLKKRHCYKSLTHAVNGCSFNNYLQTVESNTDLPELQLDFRLCKAIIKEQKQLNCTKLYAIVLNVASPTFYEPVEDIQVPHFDLDDSTDNESIISLTIIPKEPNPAVLEASAIFTSADNRTYTCQLEAVPLNFADFFLPLPASADERLAIFNQLWDHVTSECQRDGSVCAQSVMTLPFTASQLHPVIEEKLSEYITARPEINSSCWKVGIFLPPRWHLLLKMTSTDITVVNINADNWRLLPLICDYLSRFMEEGAAST